MTDLIVDDVVFSPDSIPPLDAPEYPCVECGREAGPYSGRGRKPTRCAEHKKNPSPKGGKSRTTGKSAQLAGQAADTLAQYNDLVAFLAIVAKYENTGEAIQNANDEFRERAYNALLTDPDLAQRIVANGGISGKAALIISYAMLAGAVAPVAVLEGKLHKAEKEAAHEMAEMDR